MCSSDLLQLTFPYELLSKLEDCLLHGKQLILVLGDQKGLFLFGFRFDISVDHLRKLLVEVVHMYLIVACSN